MASEIAAAVVSVMMLNLLLSSVAEARTCQTYNITDSSCPSVGECVARCEVLRYTGGICVAPVDQLVCMCQNCSDEMQINDRSAGPSRMRTEQIGA